VGIFTRIKENARRRQRFCAMGALRRLGGSAEATSDQALRRWQTDRIPFLCECADAFCDGRVALRITDWQGVARQRRHYVMLSGHPRSEQEKVVGTLEGYGVVLKPG
jgi:hypothetical protein